MNFNRKTQCDSQGSIENIPPTTKADTLPIQRGKQRTVLGVLSENEQRGRSLSQVNDSKPLFSAHSSPFTGQNFSNRFICLYRPVNVLNTARPQTDPTSNSTAARPLPPLMCMWRRPVKLFLLRLVMKCSQAAAPSTSNTLPCKIKMLESFWNWIQVSFMVASPSSLPYTTNYPSILITYWTHTLVGSPPFF